ncbi:MAG: pirin family protein, partial [Novosphingobium sp.]|nr:pirin family protein [Novosphingobium sp.]
MPRWATFRANGFTRSPSRPGHLGNNRRSHVSILQTVTPVTHDLGQFEVRRAVPSAQCRMVGPFIFVDQFGPARLDVGSGMDVRPHPHIGLATVTWLFDGDYAGAIDHR